MKYTTVQKFADTRFGSSATLRYEPSGYERNYVLRCRDRGGYLYFKKHYRTAAMAKLDLEKVVSPHCCQYSDWHTVSGMVCDPWDIVLEDNPYIMHGGVSHLGETLDEFLEDAEKDFHSLTAKEINALLHECGIKTVF